MKTPLIMIGSAAFAPEINGELSSRWEYLIELVKYYDWNRGAELGIWYGQTFFNLMDAHPSLHLIGVDIWTDHDCDKVSHHGNQAKNRAEVYRRHERGGYAGRSEIMEMTTAEAAKLVPDESLDFVFIDAAHDYDSVCADITNWAPKVKPGGFLTGHDYEWPTVAAAVHDCLSGVHVHNAGGDYMWACRKPGGNEG